MSPTRTIPPASTPGRSGIALADEQESTPPPIAAGAGGAAEWSATRRVAFRFVFAYLVLYASPIAVALIPGLGFVGDWNTRLWTAVVPWVGANVLRLARPVVAVESGSGDTTFDFVTVFCFVVIAVAVTAVWSLRARRREYARLDQWLRIFLRFVLGAVMLGYGGLKVVKSQFPSANPDRLMEPIGELSPMGLLWTFMGYSYAYNVFTGLGEMVGGVLLFFRRTALAGALLVIVVMSNVVMLNFAFDVPVKLYSSHLLLMAAYLALPDAKRLIAFLFHDRAVAPRSRFVPFPAGWRNRVRIALKTAFIPLAIGMPLHQAWRSRHTRGDAAPKPALFGVYDVKTFVRNGSVVAPLATDTSRWRRVIFARPGILAVRMMTDSLRRYLLEHDATTHRLTFHTVASPQTRWTLAYLRPDSDHVVLDGVVRGDTLHLELSRVDHTRFLLVTRGFHWINEVPFNR